MSLEAMTWAIELEGLTPTENHVLLLLANRHNKDTGLCYPSMSRISAEGGMARRTVIRAVKSLEKKGLLTVEKTFGKTHHYRLHTGATVTPVTESHGSQRVTPPVTESHNTRDTVSHKPKRTQTKPKSGFKPPTLKEVTDYCTERKNGIDPQRFVDHYEANGWMRGKNKIKCWKACIRTWESRDEKPKSQWKGGI